VDRLLLVRVRVLLLLQVLALALALVLLALVRVLVLVLFVLVLVLVPAMEAGAMVPTEAAPKDPLAKEAHPPQRIFYSSQDLPHFYH